jgi:hypothetical protein
MKVNKKNYEVQFLFNSMLNDEIEKKNIQLKIEPKKDST